MTSPNEHYIFENLFENVTWYECKGVLHIGQTTGRPGHWTAHPNCRKRLRGWIGFSDINQAKTTVVCDLCVAVHMAKRVADKQSEVTK